MADWPNSTSALRAKVEAHIEQLVDLLDTIDGDADFEDNGDYEPSVGFYVTQDGRYFLDTERDDGDMDSGQLIEGGGYYL